ncbi:MAG: hypothetical protein RJA10_2047 [Pseudomonadota bacterium]|jgi:SulP family sulfate permease
MAVPTSDPRWRTASTTSLWAEVQGGTVGSLSVLAVVLTLGLLAFSPLGASAAAVGLTATFVTAVLGGLTYATTGRSALPVAGPSSATALILASLVSTLLADPRMVQRPDTGVIVAAIGAAVALSGLIQVLLVHLGLTGLARLVPRPVLAGFMNGVALLILFGQVPLLLGLLPGATPGPQLLGALQPGALALGLAVAATILLLARWQPGWPAALIALAAGMAAFAAIKAVWPAAAMGPAIGKVAVHWHDLVPVISWAQAPDRQILLDNAVPIALTALVLALIGGLESTLNLLALDQQMEVRSQPGTELRAVGISNVVCGVLGGLPVVMLRARATATLQAGGRTWRAAVAGSVALGLLYAFGGPLLAQMPLPVLGGVMVTVGLGLIDRWTGEVLLRWWRGENSGELRIGLLVMALVCGLTLWQGFTAGVMLGVLLSMVVFIARMNRSLLRSRLTAEGRPSRRAYPEPLEQHLKPLRRHIEVWELEGALFFGNGDRLLALGDELPPTVRALVLDLRRVTSIDETGAMALSTLGNQLSRRSVQVLASGLAPGSAPERALLAYGLTVQRLPDADRAIEAAEALVLGPVADTTLSGRPLEECSLLTGLTPAQIKAVRSLMTEKRLYAGETLFRQGDAADGMYVLTLGSVSVIGRDGSSTQRFLSISPGMMLGETAMLDGGGRSADAVADTFAVVHRLSKQDLQALEEQHPAIASRLHANIAVHLSVRLRAASAAWWASQH